MDTQDPRFINAYNDLVASFFRFMNVVSPAPSAEVQIQMICRSMQTIVDSLRTTGQMPVTQPVGQPTAQPAPASQPVVETPVSQPAETPVVVPQPKPEPAKPAAIVWEEKRFGPMPTTTSEDIFKFMFKQLKREEMLGEDFDINDFPFILQFTGTDGIFTLNDEILMPMIRAKEVSTDLVKVNGTLSPDCTLTVTTPGTIEKSTGGWEVKKPIIVTAQ